MRAYAIWEMGRARRTGGPEILTPREWEVLALLREGLSNPGIADRLGISLDGAKYHVGEIISKLGVSSRYEAAQWQPDSESKPKIGLFSTLRWHARSVAVPLAATPILVAVVAVALLTWGVLRADNASRPWSLVYLSPQPPKATPTAPSQQPQLTMPAGQIAATTVVSDKVAWAVGSGGVFRTADGGRSWSLAYVSPEPLFGIAAATDGLHGWAVGGLGTILRTEDGGATWLTQPTATVANLSHIAILDNNTALAAGIGTGYSDVGGFGAHTLLRTDNGGASWNELRLGDGAGVAAMEFLRDGRHGWIAAESCGSRVSPNGDLACTNYEHTLLRSDDAGRSWQVVARGAPLFGMQFVNEQVGWATGSTCGDNSCLSAFKRTTDGGATWQTVHTPAPTSFVAFDEQTANINEPTCGAWTSLSERQCISWRTEDGGQTWQQVTAPSVYSTNGLSFFDDRRGLSGSPPRWTQDGGSTWQDAVFPIVMGTGAIDFVDDEHGWFAASRLLRTDDGGTTWLPIADKGFSNLKFVSTSEGWGTTTSPRSDPSHVTLWHTTDGGTSWQEQYGVDAQSLPRISFTTRSNGWLLWEGDGRARHTHDGGLSWYEQTLPTQGQPGSTGKVDFVGASIGFAATAAGHVYVTADGGDHWTSAGDLGTGVCSVLQISGATPLVVRVVAGGCAGTRALYQSNDGGHTWSSMPLDASINSVTFFDSRVGRALANVCDQEGCSGSRVVRTFDGGSTWTTDGAVLPTASASVFTSPGRLWLVSAKSGHFSSFSERLYRYELP